MSLASSSAYRKTKYSALDTAREVKDSIARVHDKLAKFVVFVRTDHLTLATVHGYWQQERRATLKIGTISRELGMDVGDVLNTVRALLDATAELPLPDFCANEAPDLFAAIDSIAPDDVLVGDGRNAAERFQYAVELRTALLNHTLAVLSQRYPSSPFTSLQLATEWTHAFTLLLQEVEEIIIQTQQLICDEATAAQSYLDKFRNDLEFLDMQARGAALLVRGDWQRLLENTERQILDVLESRHSRLATLTFSELRRPRETGWLEVIAQATMKRAPALGVLLLTLAGGATLLVPTLQNRTPAPALPAPVADNSGTFPVLARHTFEVAEATLSTIQDEVHAFFNAMPRPRGRVSITIPDAGTFGRVIEELSHFGYARTEILNLFGLTSTDSMSAPMMLDVRWSQGGRPLLLPPYSAGSNAFIPATPENTVSLSALTGTFGLRAQAAIAASFETAPQAAVVTERLPSAAPTVADSKSAVRFVGESKPISSMVVHYVQGGESLAGIAEQYGTTADAIIGDNQLTTALQYGQMLLVRVTGNVVTASSAPPPALVGAEGVQSSGSFPAVAAPVAPTSNYDELVNRYGSTLYPSVEAMPEELRAYYSDTVQQVADFFNVRPGDILGILQAENNNAGLRLHQPAVSSAGAMGVGQIIAQTWNGWRNPYSASHQNDMREIVQYGGLGFDWSARDVWRAYQDGSVGLDALADTHADPMSFEDSIAGVARHFADYGITRDLAERDPAAFQERLANAISIYNSGQPLAVAADYTQSAANQKTTNEYVQGAMAVANSTPISLSVGGGDMKVIAAPMASSPLRDAYTRLMDQYLGTKPTPQELTERVDHSPLASDVANGKITAEQAAHEVWNQTVQAYMAQGRAAFEAGQPVPWPHIHNDESLVVQQIAVQFLGHPLSGQEVRDLLNAHGGNQNAVTQAIATRDDARLFAGARLRFDRLLQRSERGLPIYNYEIAAHLQPLLAGYPTQGLAEATLQTLLTQFENVVRHQPEYRQLHGVTAFSANPYLNMPRLTRAFGVEVDYQAGGTHTGIDLAAPMDPQSGEPTIHAVEAGTVTYVGPLYCDADNACRGEHAVVIDHGNDVYTIYSHNSHANVQTGQRVSAGQAIARQGNEGYSFGSHLHFEVHTGVPFSGDWTEPFRGGQFEDPMKWLPN